MKTDMTVAKTILEQLGGNRFIAMTGAHSFTGYNDGLIFKLPRGAKNSIKAVKITLDASDTYTMGFLKQKRASSFEVIKVTEHSGIYFDMMEEVFTKETGLYTRL